MRSGAHTNATLIVLASAIGLLTPIGFAAETAAGASFQGLGFVDHCYASKATGISADGHTVVGWCDEGTYIQRGFVWTEAAGMLRIQSSSDHCRPQAVSANGMVVLGASDGVACKWVPDGPNGAWVALGLTGINSASEAFSSSADADVIVGYSAALQAYRWTQQSGPLWLGDLDGGGYQSVAFGVSADGTVVVGRGISNLGDEAFRWDAQHGMVGLGDLPGGGFFSTAYAASADGAVIVGHGAASGVACEAFRWTADTGMVGLGDLPTGEVRSMALAVSWDGRFVTGYGSTDNGWEAFLWGKALGMRNLKDVLEQDCGLDLGGWQLDVAYGISADGSVLAGWGHNPAGDIEAWVATVPEPTTLALVAAGVCVAIWNRTRRVYGLPTPPSPPHTGSASARGG
jgi:probable HAF family extracellular repeat protein